MSDDPKMPKYADATGQVRTFFIGNTVQKYMKITHQSVHVVAYNELDKLCESAVRIARSTRKHKELWRTPAFRAPDGEWIALELELFLSDDPTYDARVTRLRKVSALPPTAPKPR